MQQRKGFTLIELLVVISIIALLIGILLPALGAARRTARQMTNSTQLRGIQQGMVIFAQGNKENFPGLRGDGVVGTSGNLNVDGAAANAADRYTVLSAENAFLPRTRLAVMLNANTFTPDYIINPVDTVKTEAVEANDMTAENHSYAAIQLRSSSAALTAGTDGPIAQRGNEWSETLNTEAAVMSDRNTGNTAAVGTDISSPWTELDSGEWRGTVVRNDNSTAFETSAILENLRHGSGDLYEFDNLFSDVAGNGINEVSGSAMHQIDDNALMTYNGGSRNDNHD